MNTPTPNRPSLWRVMQDAYFKGRNPGNSDHHGYAAEIRAIADEMVLQFDPWLEEHAAVADWLEAEARRAERNDA